MWRLTYSCAKLVKSSAWLGLVPDCYMVFFKRQSLRKGKTLTRGIVLFCAPIACVVRPSYTIGGNHVGLRRQSIKLNLPYLYALSPPCYPSGTVRRQRCLLASLRSVRKLLQV